MLAVGPLRKMLAESEKDYQRARKTKAVFRAVARTTVSTDYFMMPATSLDNRFDLPPFLPILRNQDGLFGTTLQIASPHLFTGHLPIAIRHEPPQPRMFDDDEVWQHLDRLRAADYLIQLFSVHEFGVGSRSFEQRMESIGRWHLDLGTLPSADFALALMELRNKFLSAKARNLEARLEREALHTSLKSDIENGLENLYKRIFSDEELVPLDLRSPHRDYKESLQLFAHIVQRYGQLLMHWFAIKLAAKTWTSPS